MPQFVLARPAPETVRSARDPVWSMSLTLITGPANAAKAGAVLERLRAALPRDPLLVVPTAGDVEHYQRELAGSGIVFGAEVLTFARLVREIASRTGLEARPLGPVARERVVRAAIADVPLRVLAGSGATPGFADAAGALFAELQRSLVPPARFTSALRAWAAGGGRAAYADELAALYAAYRRRLEQLGRPDREGHAWAALDALRADPQAWGGRPVFLYGFDDLTPTERDAVETLGRHADVCVALPYEPGRVAFAGRAATVEELRPLATEVVHLPERSEHYAPGARPALHHLERSLFEPAPARKLPNGAVRLLEAGGERAEAELVGAAVLELMRQGIAAPDIAVLLRGDAGIAALFAQVLAGYGIPVSHDRRVALARTRLGAGVLAGARAALPGGTAADLLTWLRTPGRLADVAPADALDVRVRRGGVRSARTAREIWEQRLGAPPLAALDDIAAAADEGPEALLAALEAEAEAIWTAPHRRRADVLAAEDLADARVAADLRAATAELRALAAADATLLGTPDELLDALGAVEVREPSAVAGAALGTPAEALLGGTAGDGGAPAGAPAPPQGVLLADPLAIRARRFRAVFVCGLQDGEFPRRPIPEPFLSDEDRRGIATAAGLRLPLHEDVLDRERSLFYAAVSRPEDVLFLSWRSSDEEGDPLAPSAFLDDVRALFTDDLWDERGTRLLADVTWRPRDAPTPHELRRAYAAAAAQPEPAPLGAPADRRGPRPARRARDRAGTRARGVRRLRRALADRAAPAPAADRSRPGAAAAWLDRARGPGAHARAAARADGLRPARAGAARRRAGGARRRAARAGAGERRAGARARAAARARGGPPALPADRGRVRGGVRADGAGVVVRRRRRPARAAAGRGRGARHRPGRPRRRRPGRRGGRARLQGPQRRGRGEVGRGAAAPGGALPPGGTRAARPRAGRRPLPAAGRRQARRPRARARRGPGPLHADRPRRRRRLRRRARGGARARRADRRRAARRPDRALPRALLEPRVPLPGDLPRRRAQGGAPGMRSTPEQRAAIADRGRSSLLAAGAGSGKTAVMVERFAEAVRHDGVPVGAILTLTFTEKAAAELRERIRRRFVELGEDEHARAVDAAWIGTIHGFCARVLQSQPLAAGLDPTFTVLDEGAARRLAATAFERALEAWMARHGAPAVDVAAAYSWDLETMITGAHAALRARGATHPRLQVPAAAAPDPAPLAAAAVAAAAALRSAPSNGARVTAALEALEACERLLGAGPPLPGALDTAKLPTGAKALEHEACGAYREAWAAYRAACADHHARPTLVLLDALLQAFATAYAAVKDERAGVDFEDLELRVRDLLAGDAALRARWAERFALIMVDEFQDTNRLQLDVLESLERGNLFAVGDESQSIYGFRYADVGIFRARRAALGPTDPVASPSTSGRDTRSWMSSTRRSRPCSGPGSRRSWPDALRRSCGCSRRTRRRSRGSSCSPARPPAGTSARPSSGSRRSPRSRGGGPRRAPWPRGCVPRSTPAARSATSSCSSARRARCGSTSRRSRSRG